MNPEGCILKRRRLTHTLGKSDAFYLVRLKEEYPPRALFEKECEVCQNATA